MIAAIRSASSLMQQLKELRLSLGWPQVRLARMVGCSHDDISRWEAGLHHPRDIAVCELAQAMGYKLVLVKSEDAGDRIASSVADDDPGAAGAPWSWLAAEFEP